jgi:hypothetical protein
MATSLNIEFCIELKKKYYEKEKHLLSMLGL